MWFIGVEVEQETSAPPPKKNPGSAPEIRQFHVVVVQRRERNVQKSVMYMQSCCFVCPETYCFFAAVIVASTP